MLSEKDVFWLNRIRKLRRRGQLYYNRGLYVRANRMWLLAKQIEDNAGLHWWR